MIECCEYKRLLKLKTAGDAVDYQLALLTHHEAECPKCKRLGITVRHAISAIMEDSQPVTCADCGIPYASLGLDLVLPDQQWRVLFPEGSGLLCANCICTRAATLTGATCIMAWIDNMDYTTPYGRTADE